MAKRKYNYYEVAPVAEHEETFENYRDALRYWGKCQSHATIWGIDNKGRMHNVRTK